MKHNLLLIANKPGLTVSMITQEYNSYQAAIEAVELLRKELYTTTEYSIKYFITEKGE